MGGLPFQETHISPALKGTLEDDEFSSSIGEVCVSSLEGNESLLLMVMLVPSLGDMGGKKQ